MSGFQDFQVTLGILDTSGKYLTKTNPSGRNDSRLSFDHIFNGRGFITVLCSLMEELPLKNKNDGKSDVSSLLDTEIGADAGLGSFPPII